MFLGPMKIRENKYLEERSIKSNQNSSQWEFISKMIDKWPV